MEICLFGLLVDCDLIFRCWAREVGIRKRKMTDPMLVCLIVYMSEFFVGSVSVSLWRCLCLRRAGHFLFL